MLHTTRRKFAFYLGLGLFSLAERLNASALDDLAASAMSVGENTDPSSEPKAVPEHWVSAENRSWTWYEREEFTDGEWRLTGLTTPVNKLTGERISAESGYLSDDLVPAEVGIASRRDSEEDSPGQEDGTYEGQPATQRRSRHGRPPSKWLRRLNADELRIWLNQIDVPEVGVSGMSFWTHLTRDHSFREEFINGLAEEEQAKLHAAAHYGY